VLEIACGNGSNLIPMAYGLPASEFVGVDLAAKPVEMARERIQRMGLKNVRIESMDLVEIGPDFGEFDYIIAHGVYAWVPEHVQEKILAICNANLSAKGVAFVSYNTNPAGHVRKILREMARYHEERSGRASDRAEDRVKAAREVLKSLLKTVDSRSAWKALLEEELKLTFSRDENVVYHDDLAEYFLPVSFGEFAKRAENKGLQFVSEASLKDVLEPELEEQAFASLRQLAQGDLIAYEQYMDFVRHRRFRQTLLCRSEISLKREAVPARARELLVASPLRVVAERPDSAVEFRNSRGAGTLTTNNPVIIAVLRQLEKMWPRATRFDELASAMLPLVPEAQQADAVEGLGQAVLKLAASQLVDLRTYELPVAMGVSEKPAASLLARVMVQEGGTVTTLLHTHVNIEDEQGRKFLQLLDGTRDRQSLIDAIASEYPNDSRETIARQVDGNLVNFYQLGLLVA